MNARLFRNTAWIAALAALIAVPTALAQHQHGGGATAPRSGCMGHAPASGQEAAMPMDHCRQMMTTKKEMMEKCKAMDAELEQLIARMKRATGDEKIAAMERVLEELAAQRTAMRQMMMQMQEKMMGHMMQHMTMGMHRGAKGAGGCPMMQEKMEHKEPEGGEGTETPPEGGSHSAHH